MPNKEIPPQQIPHVELGAGLLAFSRPWPNHDSPVPNEEEALRHLEHAYYVHGIQFFDTSGSSYDSVSHDGKHRSSEERLGKFLRTLSKTQRRRIVVSTKAGWHFDSIKNDYYIDHRFIPLFKSINRSIRRLGTVPDILFIQKLSSETLKNRRRMLAVRSAMFYGKLRGIRHIGAAHAVGDLEAARIIAQDRRFSHQQLSFNDVLAQDQKHRELFNLAQENKKCIVVNRAFAQGEIMNNTNQRADDVAVSAFISIINHVNPNSSVVILTGTVKHLEQNTEAYHRAKRLSLLRRH